MDYERQVEVAPTEETIGEGYVTPEVQRPRRWSPGGRSLDVVLLGAAGALAAWLALRRRSRGRDSWRSPSSAWPTSASYREGCVCPIGSIQNVAVALVDPAYAVPYSRDRGLHAAAGRGAVLRPGLLQRASAPWGRSRSWWFSSRSPCRRRLDRRLGWLRWVYLTARGDLRRAAPVAYRDFVICRFDPFVGLFRFTGPRHGC